MKKRNGDCVHKAAPVNHFGGNEWEMKKIYLLGPQGT